MLPKDLLNDLEKDVSRAKEIVKFALEKAPESDNFSWNIQELQYPQQMERHFTERAKYSQQAGSQPHWLGDLGSWGGL